MRGAERGDGGEAVEAADAVVGVHDEVADAEAGRLGDDVGGAPRLAPRPHQPVAQDVLLADDGEVRRLEALLEAQHGEARSRRPAAAAASAKLSTLLRCRRARARPSSVASRSRAPGVKAATITRLPCACRSRTWRGRGVEHVDALAGALERRSCARPGRRSERTLRRLSPLRAACSNGVMWRTVRAGQQLRPTPRSSRNMAAAGTGL